MSLDIHNRYYQEDINRVLSIDLPWANLYQKTILITGATGLIGSFLIDVLMCLNFEKKAHVRVLALGRNKNRARERFNLYFDQPDFIFVEQDIRTPLDDNLRSDYIIHGAGNSHPVAFSTDPVGTITTNVIGTINILNYAITQSKCRIIFLSSVEIYGENRGDVNDFLEDYCGYINCNTLRACYPEAKRICESLCQSHKSLYGTDVIIARLCRSYGPTMIESDSKATAQFIKKALASEDIVLKSKGDQLYSFIYTVDVVSALMTILFRGNSGEAYNVASPESNINLRDFAEVTAGLVGKKVVFELPSETEMRGFSVVNKATLNSSKLMSLGWKAIYNVETGIKQTLLILK
jgi:nucleoside-diphosphate-sugar epimerase